MTATIRKALFAATQAKPSIQTNAEKTQLVEFLQKNSMAGTNPNIYSPQNKVFDKRIEVPSIYNHRTSRSIVNTSDKPPQMLQSNAASFLSPTGMRTTINGPFSCK